MSASISHDIARILHAGPIEHVGSTAVPGLVAKPVIDIMAGVKDLEDSRQAFPVLSDLGYVYFPYRPNVMHWFCKPSPAFRTHHLHLVPFRSRLWIERLVFRDCLRLDPVTAREYGELKQDLAKQHELDREAYTQAKEPFVRRVLERALAAKPRSVRPAASHRPSPPFPREERRKTK